MQTFETKNLEKPLSEEELKCLLKRYDKTGDRKLNRQELKVAFKDLGLWFCCLRAYHADINKDGLIFDDEMDVLVEYAVKWGFTLT
ncbi:hypothetical protein RND71_026897 [Anisodus tanguticus]|uniref:EF-hand domain-containing protein n=1 Tax=Anisodus tanguticus TaxID=243964 RepID=A0AAE1RN17_9SOLA|nr:hypothetical protein RND71_026897 [Anisodus tanguticus]